MVLAFALCSSSVFGAPQTFTIAESGGDYSNLETAINAKEGDYTGNAGGSITFRIEGVWTSTDTTGITVHNYTLGASSGMLIQTVGDARHDGKWDNSAYICYDLNTYAQTGTNGYIIIDGIQIEIRNTARMYTYSAYTDVTNCIFRQTSADNVNAHCLLQRGGGKIINCIFYKTGGAGTGGGFNLRAGGYSYNNTVHGFLGGTGVISGTGGGVYKNTISYNNQTDFSAGAINTSTNNLSKDGTAPPYNVYYTTKTISFVNAAAGDFHLAATDTDAIDNGADLSSIFTTDIDGVTRTGTWDIGADEYVSAEPPAALVPFLQPVMIWEN